MKKRVHLQEACRENPLGCEGFVKCIWNMAFEQRTEPRVLGMKNPQLARLRQVRLL